MMGCSTFTGNLFSVGALTLAVQSRMKQGSIMPLQRFNYASLKVHLQSLKKKKRRRRKRLFGMPGYMYGKRNAVVFSLTKVV